MVATALAARHWFGLHAPMGYVGAVWGARALYTAGNIALTTNMPRRLTSEAQRRRTAITFNVQIDLMHDRMQLDGGNVNERTALSTWIDRYGLVLLRARLVEKFILTSSTEVITVEDQGFVITGAPRRSHGYLYLVAHRKIEAARGGDS